MLRVGMYVVREWALADWPRTGGVRFAIFMFIYLWNAPIVL